MTQLLLTIIIGIGIAAVATAGALTLFQSAREGVDQQLLWARMEQAASALRSKIIIVDGLPTLPMAETTTDSYPAVPTWVTAAALDNNGKRFVYCPFALRDTSVEGTSTTVTGPGYSVVKYNSTITGSKDYVVGATIPTLSGTPSAAPQGLLGVLISFKPKDTYSSSVAVNWCNNLSVSAAGIISASYSSQTGIVYPISVPQGQIQQAFAKRDQVTLYVSTSASGDGTGRNTSNYTTLNAAFAQLAALRPYRAKIYLTTGTHTVSAIAKTDAGANDVYNRGNLRQTIYDFEGVGLGTIISFSTPYDLPVNTYFRSLTVSGSTVTVPANSKMIINNARVDNLYVKNGTAWVSGTSYLHTGLTVTDMGRLVIKGDVDSTVLDQGIKIQPGRVDILPSATWDILLDSSSATPSAPIIVYGGGTLSNSGSITVSVDTGNLKSALNVVPGGNVYMNNSTMTINASAQGDGTSRKGAIVMGGAMYMVNSGLLFPSGTATGVAGVVLVDGGKFFMHGGSYIGSSSNSSQRPYIGVYDNGGSQVGGSTAGYTSGAAGEGGGARSHIYANSSGKCWDGSGDPYGQGIPSAQQRHLFIDSDEGDTKYSSPRDTCGSNTNGTCSTTTAKNLLTYSDNLSVNWSTLTDGSGSSSTVTNYSIDAPDSSHSAIRLSFARPNVGTWVYRNYNSPSSITPTGQLTASIWMRPVNAGDVGKTISFKMWSGSDRNTTNVTLLSGWNRYTMTNTYSFTGAATSVFSIGLGNFGGNSTTSVGVDMWGAQVEAGASRTTYEPVGANQNNTSNDYRHLRFTNTSDWQCHGPSGGGGDTDPDDGGVLAGCPATNSTGTYTTTPNTTPTGFDTATTISISCPGCAAVSGYAGYSKNGGGSTTAVGTFSPGDNFNIQFCFGVNGAATATVTIGTTNYTCEYTKTGRISPACTVPTP